MVEDLTKTLDRWDRWVEHNPQKVDAFFRNAVTDTENIAGSLGDAAKGLNDMATELRPLLGPLTRLVSLAGSLSSNLSPGAAATLLLGVRGLRNRVAGPAAIGGGAAVPGGAGGAGSFLPWLAGAGGASAGARLSARGMSTYAVGRELGAGRLAAGWGAAPSLAGGAALRTGGAVGRFALPALAIGGLQGAFGTGGASQGQGWFGQGMWGIRNAAQGAGAMFGIANPVLGTDERVNRGQARAAQFLGALPGAMSPTARQARAAASQLRPELSRAEQAAADAIDNRNDYREALAYLKALRAQATAYRDIAREARHARTAELNAQSRAHGQQLTQSYGKAFDTYSQRMSPGAAMEKTVEGCTGRCAGCAARGRRSSVRTSSRGRASRRARTPRSRARSTG
jgi:hypothetical protein